MKLICKRVLPVLLICALLSGCSFWMDGAYVSVTPNRPQSVNRTDEITLITSYQQVSKFITEMVEGGIQEGVMYYANVTEEQVVYFMDTAISYVVRTNPTGAYAVDKITYDIGDNMGKQAIAVTISYNHSRSEILRIRNAGSMENALKLIQIALDNCESAMVLRVNDYRGQDLIQHVEDYVAFHPQSCMESPQVSVNYFPELGQERIIEILFTYQTSRDTLRTMQQSVSNIFKSAMYYIDPMAETEEKCSQLYSFLMERYDYKLDTSITPTYSLLRHGVGDSRAFAMVYGAMCRQVGLDCQMVSGTKNGEAWYWNVIQEEDEIYHVDLLACNEQGFFEMKTAEQMDGYVWDYSEY